jgi:hypothetical protein
MRNNNILLGDLVKASQKNLLGDRDDSDAHTGVPLKPFYFYDPMSGRFKEVLVYIEFETNVKLNLL